MLKEQSATGASFVRPKPSWINLREDIVELFQEAQDFVIQKAWEYRQKNREFEAFMKRKGFNSYTDRLEQREKCLYCDKPTAPVKHGTSSKRFFCYEHQDWKVRRALTNYKIERTLVVVEHRVPAVAPISREIKRNQPVLGHLPLEHECPECKIKFGRIHGLRAHVAAKHKVCLSDFMYAYEQAAE